MILLTGAAGFIGSYYLERANRAGFSDFIIVDDFEARTDKTPNWQGAKYAHRVAREQLWAWLEAEQPKLTAIVHLGARTDTTEFNEAIFDHLNVDYSQKIFAYAAKHGLPLVYASSAATYGGGEEGYDDHTLPAMLKPLNPYGRSKNDFDAWALEQTEQPPFWVGLKFFNVYGPHENHKGRMASVVWHTRQQILKTGQMRLFRSHRADYADGQQLRDFIHVEDLCRVMDFMLEAQPNSGLYNLGTGQARSFWDLASATFKAMGLEPNIEFIDMPQDLRATYQYYTQADLSKLRAAGYEAAFLSLEEGVASYVAWLEAQQA